MLVYVALHQRAVATRGRRHRVAVAKLHSIRQLARCSINRQRPADEPRTRPLDTVTASEGRRHDRALSNVGPCTRWVPRTIRASRAGRRVADVRHGARVGAREQARAASVRVDGDRRIRRAPGTVGGVCAPPEASVAATSVETLYVARRLERPRRRTDLPTRGSPCRHAAINTPMMRRCRPLDAAVDVFIMQPSTVHRARPSRTENSGHGVALAASLGVPHVEIDALHHGPGWVPRNTFAEKRPHFRQPSPRARASDRRFGASGWHFSPEAGATATNVLPRMPWCCQARGRPCTVTPMRSVPRRDAAVPHVASRKPVAAPGKCRASRHVRRRIKTHYKQEAGASRPRERV